MEINAKKLDGSPLRKAMKASLTRGGIKPYRLQKQALLGMESSHKGNRNKPLGGWNQATNATETSHTEDGIKPMDSRSKPYWGMGMESSHTENGIKPQRQ